MLISNALEKLKYFYIVFLSMFTLAGSVVGIIAAEIYLRISFPYFYMTQGLWSGSIEPVLSNGLYTGALLGMVTGSISLLSGERPMLRNEIFKTALRIVFLALITSLITGVTASILASLSPNIYRIFSCSPFLMITCNRKQQSLHLWGDLSGDGILDWFGFLPAAGTKRDASKYPFTRIQRIPGNHHRKSILRPFKVNTYDVDSMDCRHSIVAVLRVDNLPEWLSLLAAVYSTQKNSFLDTVVMRPFWCCRIVSFTGYCD